MALTPSIATRVLHLPSDECILSSLETAPITSVAHLACFSPSSTSFRRGEPRLRDSFLLHTYSLVVWRSRECSRVSFCNLKLSSHSAASHGISQCPS